MPDSSNLPPSSVPEVIDLSLANLPGRGSLTIAPQEHEEDRRSRLRIEGRSALIEDCKGIVIFSIFVIGIVLAAIGCVYEGFFVADANPDTKRLTQTLLSSIVTGSISFVVGRKIPK